MVVRRWERKLKLRRWPVEDWDFSHPLYRFIKGTFHAPMSWLMRIQVRGQENIPTTGPVILAVNHLSWADPIAMGVALKRPAFYLAKEGVFKHPLTRWIVTATGQIKVDRTVGKNEGALDTALDLLKQGLVVGVFPEGTRSRPGQVKRGKTGLARIAAVSGAPIVPVGMDTGHFWPRGRSMPYLGRPVYIDIGKPFTLDIKPEDIGDKVKLRDATDEVMDKVRVLYHNAVAAREKRERWG
jgi:1-acyl-sn-glycerol-3-phosphate acyltransferase